MAGQFSLQDIEDTASNLAHNAYNAFMTGAKDTAANVKPAWNQIVNYDYSGAARRAMDTLQQMKDQAQFRARSASASGVTPSSVWNGLKQTAVDGWNLLKNAKANAYTVPSALQQTGTTLPDTLNQANQYLQNR